MRTAPQRARLIFLGLAAALTSAACDGLRMNSADAVQVTPRAAKRIIVDARWDTAFTATAYTDTSLVRPRVIEVRNRVVYVYDYGDARIKAYDNSGTPRWQFESSAMGAPALGNVVDLETAPSGALWAVAYGPRGTSKRIIVLSHDGTHVTDLPFSDDLLRLVPTSDEMLAAVLDEKHFLVVLDSAGRRSGQVHFPLRELSAANPQMRQPITASNGDGTRWAAAFPFGDLLIAYQGRTPVCAGRLVEGEAFPAEHVRGVRRDVWAVSIALSDSNIFVLPKGRTEHAQQVLDEYSATDCSYRRTLPLPRRMQAVDADADVLYFEHEQPLTGLLGLRLRRP